MTNRVLTLPKIILLILLAYFLAACSSQPIVINHYLLNTSKPSASQTIENDNDLSVLITNVSLPDYLNSSNLVMQQANGMLSVATKHVWAQPLDSGLGTLLANSLSDYNGLRAYYGAHSGTMMQGFSAHSDFRLAISIEHFMSIGSGEVVLVGFWQLSSKEAIHKPKRFELKAAMTESGYLHSVEKMRSLVKDLAASIEGDLINQKI